MFMAGLTEKGTLELVATPGKGNDSSENLTLRKCLRVSQFPIYPFLSQPKKAQYSKGFLKWDKTDLVTFIGVNFNRKLESAMIFNFSRE